ncbi:choice-of-anchor D domain-containing protein, partial [bacterium]|nr:choice-of-anchor D domain-containing protein [bacterium]
TNSWGWGIGNPSAWGMCKFVPSVACSLKRVEFWTNDITTDIDVYIYDTFSGGTLDTLLTSELDTSYAEVGYHSVALSSPPYVASGNDVYVAVKFTNSSYGWPVVADDVGPFETNKTYLSHYGSTWFEMGTNDSTDIAIRLRTTTGTMAPAISVSPDTLKFGQVQVSTDSILTLRVKNPGTDTLRVADINSSAPEFTLTDTLFSVAPSGSTNVSVTFRPTAVQIYSADLTILHNAKGSTVVPLTGEGVSAGAPGILVVPDSLKYGQVPVGVDSILTMRIKSTGTDTLHVTDIDPSDPTITLSDTAFVLAPSESTDVSVTFTPAAVQDYAESLTIFSDAVKAITVVSVTGEGIDNVAISVVPDTLKYGQVVVGSDSSLVLRVKSTGTDTLRVTDINPSNTVLTLVDTVFVLAPSESTDVTVTFTPAAVQAYAESLTIFHNAKGFTIVPVSGAGAAGADLIITTGDIQFAPPAPMVGDTVTIEARVHNVTPPKWHFVAVESVLVRFYDGDPDTGGTQIGTDQIILSIEPDSSEVAQVEWSTAGMVGYHP